MVSEGLNIWFGL